MVNSRELSDLRADVRLNCRLFLAECEAQGLKVLVTQTLRDDEYQASLYAQGRTKAGSIVTNSKVTTFHGKGLAFDICKNVKGHEYDDAAFFRQCGEIAKRIGFSWGGDWTSFPDRPHIQWDAHKQYTGSMIRSGKLPPGMPAYRKEDEEVTQEQFDKMMDNYLAGLGQKKESAWSVKEGGMEAAKAEGLMANNAPQSFVTREQLAAVLTRLLRKLRG